MAPDLAFLVKVAVTSCLLDHSYRFPILFSDFVHSFSNFPLRVARLSDGLKGSVGVSERVVADTCAAWKAKLGKPRHHNFTDFVTGSKQTDNDKTEFVRMRSAREVSSVCGQRKASMTLLRACCHSDLQTYLCCYKRFGVLFPPLY